MSDTFFVTTESLQEFLRQYREQVVIAQQAAKACRELASEVRSALEQDDE